MINLRKVFYFIIIFYFSGFAQTDTITTNIKVDSLSIENVHSSISDSSVILQNKSPETIYKTDTVKIPLIPYELFSQESNGFNVESLNILKYINFWTILRIVILLVFGLLLNKLIDLLRKNKRIKNTVPFLFIVVTALKVLLWISIGYLLLYQLFSNISQLVLIFVFIVIVFLGIAILGILKNLAGGFYLSLKAPFEIGDSIQVASFSGTVKQTAWLNTIIVSEGGSEIGIPNAIFINTPIKNINKGEKEKQICMDFSFSNNIPISSIKKILHESALSSPYTFIKREPEVYVYKSNFLENTNDYKLLVFCIDSMFENQLRNSINIFINNAIKQL